MRLSHFETLRPVCPRCRRDHGADERLVVARILGEAHGQITAGIIHCPACGQEYPILDGLPLLVPDVRAYVEQALPMLLARRDLPDELESLLGDAAGPGSIMDGVRQHQSSYGWDHYAALDPAEAAPRPGDEAPGAVVRCLHAALGLLPQPLAGPVIEIGCGPGRTSFELAARTDGLVLGVDLNVPLLGLGGHALLHRRIRYPRRRIGLVYDRRDFAIDLPGADRVDFWVCDALALPFAGPTFNFVTALNLLDCLTAPLDGLAAMGAVLHAKGQAVLATPYDWSPAATPVEHWLGGHSQRGPHGGCAEPLLRRILGEPAAAGGLRLTAEAAEIPWQVRLHDRALMRYRSHVVALEKSIAP